MLNRLKMQNSVNHFMHPNQPLKLYKGEKRPWKSLGCVICGLTPSEHLKKAKFWKQKSGCGVYGCRDCVFMIHPDCAKLPQELSHPFHPQHSLSLYNTGSKKNRRFLCHACGNYPRGRYIYHCAACKFNLHIRCIGLKPLNDGQLKHQEISHQHPVFVCNQPTDFESHCSFCRFSFSKTGLIYVCVDCKHLLHESCVFPQQIMHPFHLEHPLRPVRRGGWKECNACSEYHNSFFACSQCEFFLDLSCISLKPTSLIKSSEYDDQELQDQPHTHPHPLIQCDPMIPIKYKRICSGCASPIKDSIYVCLECGVLLDNSCIKLLPGIITNAFHPIHPLILGKCKTDSSGRHLLVDILRDQTKCSVCHRNNNLLMYVCRECNFQIDTRCVASTKPYAIVNSRIHNHPLAFLIKKPGYDWSINCGTCGEPCKKYFFSCLKCPYRIHLECCPLLPRVIKHDSHCDPLIFTDSRIKDASDEDSDGEFYCHACEDLRDLDDPTYYCKECHFVAHLQCVFPAILQGLEAEPTASPTSS